MKFLRLKKAEVVQPNKPKPTTMLPQNMEWSWDPEAADWVAVLKDNDNVTPPLYNPQNQNNLGTNSTSYMSSIKSSNLFSDENTLEYEKRVQEAYRQLAGMIEEVDILSDYAKRSGGLRLFDAYIQLGREIAKEWDVRPESIFGQMVLSSPELPQKLADIDKENFSKENEEWLKKHKNSSKKVPSSNKELNALLKLLDKCWYGSGKGRYADIGNWSIGLGGYDTGYEVSYKGLPIFSITPYNELKEYLSEESLQRECGLSYDDIEKVLKSYKDLGGLKRIQCKKQTSKKYAGEEIDKVNLDFMKDIGDTSYALKLLRDGIVTRESRHFDQLVENILNDGEGSAAPLTLLSLGILNENDRYYHNAVKQCLPYPTYAASLLERGIITQDSEYYIDAVNSAIRYSDTAKELVEKGIIDEKYVGEENFRIKMKLWYALSEAILMLRENGEEFYDLKVYLSDKNRPKQELKQALDVAANRLDKIGLKEDADHCRSILKQASKKVKSELNAQTMEMIDKLVDIIEKKNNVALVQDKYIKTYDILDYDKKEFVDKDVYCWDLDEAKSRFEEYVNKKSNKTQASCLEEFLDGPRYSKEVKIEAGLIKNGLVKYAGFDFKKGTKYEITEKGLKVLRSAAEKEHNEALNEREKLAYLFGFNTNKDTTLDTTGKTITADNKDIVVIDTGSGYLQVFENKDTYTYGGHNVGEQLYQFDIDDESKHNGIAVLNVDDMISKDFYTITFENFDDLEEFVWKLKETTTQKEIAFLLNGQPKKVDSSNTFTITEADGCELGKVTASSQLDAFVKFGIEHPEYADSQSISAKVICASETEYMSVQNMKAFLKQQGAKEISFGAFTQDVPHSDSDLVKVIESHGTKKIHLTYDHYKVDVYNKGAIMIEELAKNDGRRNFRYFIFTKVSNNKNIDAKYEETTEQHLDYPNPSETPHDDIVLENHDGWVNTANKK